MTHAKLAAQHQANSGNALVLPLFQLDSIVFPHEVVTVDCRTSGMIALAAAVTRSVDGSSGLSRPFCIAESPLASVGTIAHLETRRSPRWFGTSIRLNAVCSKRCFLCGEVSNQELLDSYGEVWWYTLRSFRLLRVVPYPDLIPARISCSVQELFPILHPSTIQKRRVPGIQTRSRSLTVPKRWRRHTSLTCVEFQTYRSFQEKFLIDRLRSLAFGPQTLLHAPSASKSTQIDLDENIMKTVPTDKDSPEKWSFWFSSAMRLPEDEKRALLYEPYTILRLRRLVQILQNPPHVVESRKRQPYKRACPQSLPEQDAARAMKKRGHLSRKASDDGKIRKFDSKSTTGCMNSFPIYNPMSFSSCQERWRFRQSHPGIAFRYSRAIVRR